MVSLFNQQELMHINGEEKILLYIETHYFREQTMTRIRAKELKYFLFLL